MTSPVQSLRNQLSGVRQMRTGSGARYCGGMQPSHVALPVRSAQRSGCAGSARHQVDYVPEPRKRPRVRRLGSGNMMRENRTDEGSAPERVRLIQSAFDADPSDPDHPIKIEAMRRHAGSDQFFSVGDSQCGIGVAHLADKIGRSSRPRLRPEIG